MAQVGVGHVITIDGPSASGKSSVSRELSRRLGWRWVSTGAFYRGLACVALGENVALNDPPALVRLANEAMLWDVRLDGERTRVFYRNADVTERAMAEDNGTFASQISQLPEVRHVLLAHQRACAVHVPGLVAEGRDCGTVVFPDAILKIFLTASQEERASRRAREQGLDVTQTQDDQRARDQRDSQRKAAPLQIPEGARVVDSGGMNLDQVIERVHAWALESLAVTGK